MRGNPFVFHPFLFAVYPVLFFFSYNIRETTLSVLWLPLSFVLALSLLLWGILRFPIRNYIKRGMVVSLIFILSFSYGHLSGLFFGKNPGSYFLLIYLLIMGVLVFGIIRLKGNLSKFTIVLNTVSVFLVMFSVLNIGYYEAIHRVRIDSLGSEIFDVLAGQSERNAPEEGYPDIYYIIFDRYASSEMLAEFFDFDNTAFEASLENMGFYVASQSRTNYPYSFLSLASSLNCDYLDFLFEKTGKSNDRTIAYRLLKESQVIRILKSRGYRYFHLGSWWEPTRKNRLADKNFVFKRPKDLNLGWDEFSSNNPKGRVPRACPWVNG